MQLMPEMTPGPRRFSTARVDLAFPRQAEHPDKLGRDPGGQSFFADGFRVAKWMEENEPSAYHILTSTPIRFSIKNKGQRYGNMVPIIVTDPEGDVTEIHYNNRTMGPLQVSANW